MKNNHNKWRLNRIAGALAVALLPLCEDVLAREVFNPALLEMDGPHTGVRDLSAYEQAGGQLPGTYRVDIYLNNVFMDTRDVVFQQSKGPGITELQPCLTVDDLAEWGVRVSQFPELGRRTPGCGYQRDTAGKIRFSLQSAAPAIELPAGGGSQRRPRLGGSETVG